MPKLGGALGCLTAALVGIVFVLPLLFGLAWSGVHCDPVPQCQRANELHFGLLIGLGLAVAFAAGFVVRHFVNKYAAERDDEGTSPAFVIVSTGVTILVAVLVLIAMFHV